MSKKQGVPEGFPVRSVAKSCKKQWFWSPKNPRPGQNCALFFPEMCNFGNFGETGFYVLELEKKMGKFGPEISRKCVFSKKTTPFCAENGLPGRARTFYITWELGQRVFSDRWKTRFHFFRNVLALNLAGKFREKKRFSENNYPYSPLVVQGGVSFPYVFPVSVSRSKTPLKFL